MPTYHDDLAAVIARTPPVPLPRKGLPDWVKSITVHPTRLDELPELVLTTGTRVGPLEIQGAFAVPLKNLVARNATGTLTVVFHLP